MREKSRKEIRDAKFYILIDEALDESHMKKITIILRLVDCSDFVPEHLFYIILVDKTIIAILKKEICKSLITHNLEVKNTQGQGITMLVICMEIGWDYCIKKSLQLHIMFVIFLIGSN